MNKEQFDEWMTHPTTIEVFKEFTSVRDELRDHLASGGTLSGSAEVTLSNTAEVVGQIKGLEQLLNAYFAGDDE